MKKINMGEVIEALSPKKVSAEAAKEIPMSIEDIEYNIGKLLRFMAAGGAEYGVLAEQDLDYPIYLDSNLTSMGTCTEKGYIDFYNHFSDCTEYFKVPIDEPYTIGVDVETNTLLIGTFGEVLNELGMWHPN